MTRSRGTMPRLLAADHAPDGVLESPAGGGTVNGREAIARIYRGMFAGFPDLAVDWSDLVIDGDRVVEMGTMSGTDTGGFMGLPPTGRRFGFPHRDYLHVQGRPDRTRAPCL